MKGINTAFYNRRPVRKAECPREVPLTEWEYMRTRVYNRRRESDIEYSEEEEEDAPEENIDLSAIARSHWRMTNNSRAMETSPSSDDESITIPPMKLPIRRASPPRTTHSTLLRMEVTRKRMAAEEQNPQSCQ